MPYSWDEVSGDIANSSDNTTTVSHLQRNAELKTFLQTNLKPALTARGSLLEKQPSHTDNTSAGAEEY